MKNKIPIIKKSIKTTEDFVKNTENNSKNEEKERLPKSFPTPNTKTKNKLKINFSFKKIKEEAKKRIEESIKKLDLFFVNKKTPERSKREIIKKEKNFIFQ